MITINVIAWPASRPVTCHSMISIAPRIPKIAPDAPTTGERRLQQRAGGSGEAGDEVEPDVARASEVLLDRRADPPERVHVEADVEQGAVQEHRGDEPLPVSVRDRRPVEQRADVESLDCTRPARVVEPAALHGGDEVDRDVDPDQRLRDGRCVVAERDARRAAHRARLDARAGLPGAARVIGAADARPARTSRSRRRSAVRSRSTRARSRGRDAGSSSWVSAVDIRASLTPVMRVHVAFTPGEQTPAPVGIVVDVLRATSTICQALASGYRRVLCCAEIDEARALAETEGPAKLAGERRLEHIEGFDFGNSPSELEGEPAAETLILTTTNGTRLLVAAAERFERVYVGSLLNLDAVAAAARESGEDVAVLCAGVLGELALDDAYCAGRIAEALGGEPRTRPARRSCSRAASRARSKGSARAAAPRTCAGTASRPTSSGARGRTPSTSSRATSAASAPRPK